MLSSRLKLGRRLYSLVQAPAASRYAERSRSFTGSSCRAFITGRDDGDKVQVANTTATTDSSIGELNKERALKYLDRNFPHSKSSSPTESDSPTVVDNESSFDPASILTDDVDTQSSFAKRGKRDAKSEALKRLKKYMPVVSGSVPTVDTMRSLLQDEHGALDVTVLDVRDKASFADWMVVATGLSSTHVVAIADGLQKDMFVAGVRVGGGQVTLCGRDEGDWVVVDIGHVVVHVMTEESRAHYQLEAIWDGRDGGDDEEFIGGEKEEDSGGSGGGSIHRKEEQ